MLVSYSWKNTAGQLQSSRRYAYPNLYQNERPSSTKECFHKIKKYTIENCKNKRNTRKPPKKSPKEPKLP